MTTLGAAAGDGKSWVVTAFAYGVRVGRPAGGVECERGRALIFDAEMGADMYAERLRDADLPAIVPVYDAMGLDLSRDDDLAWFASIINHERANYVVLDSLRRLAPTAREKDSDDMALVVARVAKVARDTRAAIVLVHHRGDSEQKWYRGSTGIKDQTDALFGLLRSEGGEDVRKLACRGGKGKMRYAAEPPDRWFRLVLQGGVILEPAEPPDDTMPTAPTSTTRVDEYASRLEPAYANNPQLTQDEACALVGVAPGNKSVRDALRQLSEEPRQGGGGGGVLYPGDRHQAVTTAREGSNGHVQHDPMCRYPQHVGSSWRTHAGRVVCGECHPPADASLVAGWES